MKEFDPRIAPYMREIAPGTWACSATSAQLDAMLTPEERARLARIDGELKMKRVLLEIETERERQIEREGYSLAHDDDHTRGEIAQAAANYAQAAAVQAHALPIVGADMALQRVQMPYATWPWEEAAWKPKDQRRNLIRAAALCVAEIERLDRAASQQESDR